MKNYLKKLIIVCCLIIPIGINLGFTECTGLEPHPTDCNKYYDCVDGNQIEMSCPSGLEFNASAGYCDYPENAGCSATEPTKCLIIHAALTDKGKQWTQKNCYADDPGPDVLEGGIYNCVSQNNQTCNQTTCKSGSGCYSAD